MVYVFFNPFNQSVLDMDDFVRLVSYATFMSDDNNCQPLVFMQFFQNIHLFHGCFAVQGPGRFIGEDDLRFGYQGTCYGYTLFLSAGQFIGPMMRPFFKTLLVKVFSCHLIPFFSAHSLI